MAPHIFLLLVGFFLSCGASGVYSYCEVSGDCAAGPDEQDAACLTKSAEGFCTWECSVDADCDTDDTPGFVCASFESDAELYCFPSCEEDEDTCGAGLTCRSTGGGADNRKICFPEG